MKIADSLFSIYNEDMVSVMTRHCVGFKYLSCDALSITSQTFKWRLYLHGLLLLYINEKVFVAICEKPQPQEVRFTIYTKSEAQMKVYSSQKHTALLNLTFLEAGDCQVSISKPKLRLNCHVYTCKWKDEVCIFCSGGSLK